MVTAHVQHGATLEFLDSAPKPEDLVVYDIGCGDGFASKEFIKRGAERVLAYDTVCQNSQYFNEPMIIRVGTPIRSKVDIIWCHHVLEHQEKPILFLQNLRQFLTETGKLWLTVPCMLQNLNFSLGHVMAYNMALLIEHLKRAGFDVENGSYWKQRGHLRARVGKNGNGNYPEPMQKALTETGRCDAELFHHWNWRKH